MTSNRYISDDVDMAPLAEPLHFSYSGRTAANRFMKAAMTERNASWNEQDIAERGIPSKELINMYRRWGEASIGVIVSGNIMIDPSHLEATGNAIIPQDAPFSGERFEAFAGMAVAGKTGNSLMIAQVSHPGRQVSERIQSNPISASDVQLEGFLMGMTFAKPRAATQEDIESVIEGFAHAAEYLEKAGWDGIELHAAHGYLLSQFLSPTTNHRTDQYGGSLENRTRLIVEIAQRVRAKTSTRFVLGIKLNSVEFQDRGLQVEEARQVCAILEENAFDFVELSGGTYEKMAFTHTKESTIKREAFFIEFADLIAPVFSRTRVYLTGGFKTVGGMVAALKGVDGVGSARILAQEPRLVRDMLSGRIKGALQSAIAPDDFGTSFAATNLQLKQLSRDQEPIDVSKEENVELVQAALGSWIQTMQSGTGDEIFGMVDLLSAKPVPYGLAVQT